MITYAGYKVKIIFIIFLFLICHVVAYAEMGRDREFCYPGTPENNTTPATFFMILVQLLFQMLTTIQPVLFYHLKTGK